MTIRKQPEDFRVQETLRDDTLVHLVTASDTSHTHALLTLSKSSLTTPDACSMLARVLGVKAGVISYAGLKDKHACTVQHVSVPTASDAALVMKLQAPLQDRNWSAQLVGFLPRPLEAADIASNRFTIVVRDLTRAASDDMARRADALWSETGITLVNYFGDQRFAGVRDDFAAVHLVRGDFETALRLLVAVPHRKDMGKKREFTRLAATHWGDWKKITMHAPHVPEKRAIEALAAGRPAQEAFAQLPNLSQQMCVDAFQSHIWNGAACRCVERAVARSQVLVADDPFGPMAFPTSEQWLLPPLLHWPATNVPMPSPEAAGPAAWMEALEHELVQHRLTLADLQVPGLRRPAFGAAPRPLAVRVADFAMSDAEKDDLDATGKRGKRTLSFSLPRGAYATVLLRALGQ